MSDMEFEPNLSAVPEAARRDRFFILTENHSIELHTVLQKIDPNCYWYH